ncbi:MAG: tyrosine-type recombinase/integrase [Planctomycetes bacterium]|nr:tyrosine-type recombinase/integrase [Planctomycetota bacterium]
MKCDKGGRLRSSTKRVSLTEHFGVTNRDQAQAWAIAKSQAIREEEWEIKKRFAEGTPTIQTLEFDALVDAYLLEHANRLHELTLRDKERTYFPEFRRWLVEHRKSLRVDNLKRREFAAFMQFAAQHPAKQVTSGGAKRVSRRVNSENIRSPITVNNVARCIKALFNWAVRLQLVSMSNDDVRFGLMLLKEQRRLKSYLKPEEIDALLKAAAKHDALTMSITRESKATGANYQGMMPAKHPPLYDFVLLGLLGGFRKQELLELRWSSVDLKDGTLKVENNELTGSKPKNYERVVTFSPSRLMTETLSRLHRQRGADDIYVLGGDTPRFISTQQWKRMKAMAEINLDHVRIKDLRTTCATSLACSQGLHISFFNIARRMGHTVTTLEKHYAGHIASLPDAETLEGVMGIQTMVKKPTLRLVS